uniref:Uncharacterized protein n=1 Tax=Panagrolaimus sp. ES5 TaxID=591445 RepID=A0AC34GFY5_9BILA
MVTFYFRNNFVKILYFTEKVENLSPDIFEISDDDEVTVIEDIPPKTAEPVPKEREILSQNYQTPPPRRPRFRSASATYSASSFAKSDKASLNLKADKENINSSPDIFDVSDDDEDDEEITVLKVVPSKTAQLKPDLTSRNYRTPSPRRHRLRSASPTYSPLSPELAAKFQAAL